MKHGSLFNGIGGFQLAASWMGWENVFSCEIDDFCNKVTKKHFPNCIQYGDIKTTDFTIWRGRIDVLTGGFPCQPFSSSGKRMGTDDPRHLWPENLRVIREIQPRFVLGENVNGILNWSRGLVFEQVCSDLENEGYEVQPIVLPACGKGAPHRRDRVWFVAHSEKVSLCYATRNEGRESYQIQKKRPYEFIDSAGAGGFCIPDWTRFPTQPPVCRGDDGIPDWVDRIGSLGNAIVPQVAYEIFKAIESTLTPISGE